MKLNEYKELETDKEIIEEKKELEEENLERNHTVPGNDEKNKEKAKIRRPGNPKLIRTRQQNKTE